eukprot:Hpha_TRINITY_DN15220_c0_g9::TRINITY_DN15220_c0_g9_i1::g.64534::m.64534
MAEDSLTRFQELKGLPGQPQSVDRLREIRGLPQPVDDPSISASLKLQQLQELRSQGVPELDSAISSLREQLTHSQAGRVAVVVEEQMGRVEVANECDAESQQLMAQAPAQSAKSSEGGADVGGLEAKLMARAGGRLAAMQKQADAKPPGEEPAEQPTVPAPEEAKPVHPVQAAPAPPPQPSTPKSKARAAAEAVRGTGEGSGLRWQPGGVLGKGSFGEVIRGVLVTGGMIAVKKIALGKDGLGSKELAAIRTEVQLMQALRHPNIVEYLGTDFDEVGSNLLIFMEYADGGTLAGLVRSLPNRLEEDIAASYMRSTLQGVEFLHQNGVVHRDIKGVNILLSSRDGVCKLADFGCSKSIQDLCGATKGCETMVGTPYWMAPEVIMAQQDGASYGKASDIWSIGCTACEVLNKGLPPWPEFPNMWSAVYHIANATGPPSAMPTEVSNTARSFIIALCQRDPRERLTATTALQHPFLTNPQLGPSARTTPSAASGGGLSSIPRTVSPRTASGVSMSSVMTPPPGEPGGAATAPVATSSIGGADDSLMQRAGTASNTGGQASGQAGFAPPLQQQSLRHEDVPASSQVRRLSGQSPLSPPAAMSPSALAQSSVDSVGSRGAPQVSTPQIPAPPGTAPRSGVSGSDTDTQQRSGNMEPEGPPVCRHCGKENCHEATCSERRVGTIRGGFGSSSMGPPPVGSPPAPVRAPGAAPPRAGVGQSSFGGGGGGQPPPADPQAYAAGPGGSDGAFDSAMTMSEQPEGNTQLVPCSHCGRSFAPGRIDKHMSICEGQQHRNHMRRGNTPASSSRPKSSGGRTGSRRGR